MSYPHPVYPEQSYFRRFMGDFTTVLATFLLAPAFVIATLSGLFTTDTDEMAHGYLADVGTAAAKQEARDRVYAACADQPGTATLSGDALEPIVAHAADAAVDGVAGEHERLTAEFADHRRWSIEWVRSLIPFYSSRSPNADVSARYTTETLTLTFDATGLTGPTEERQVSLECPVVFSHSDRD